MYRWAQKKKYQGAKNEEATDCWSAKCMNSLFMEVSILVTKELHFKTHAEARYEAWNLTGLWSQVQYKSQDPE